MTGSLGMLPSASISNDDSGIFESVSTFLFRSPLHDKQCLHEQQPSV